jgi:formylglycine-generating enzyme
MSILDFLKGRTKSYENTMVLIPGGPFWMGTDAVWGDRIMDLYKDAWAPRHEVVLDPFWIDKYLVTNKVYMQFVSETGHREPASFQRLKELLSELPRGQKSSLPIQGLKTLTRSDHPVVGVTWDDAMAFCAWRSKREKGIYRLPTEAEWEKAARGGLADKKYPWGDEWQSSKCNTFERVERLPFTLRADKATTAVDAFGPNGYGLYDAYGNVEQWCLDWYEKTYYKNSPKENPRGPQSGRERVVRGNSYGSYGASCRTEGRGSESPDEDGLER